MVTNWQCVCGKINWGGVNVCPGCGKLRVNLYRGSTPPPPPPMPLDIQRKYCCQHCDK